MPPKRTPKSSPKKPHDPASDAALLALAPSFAGAPDMPVLVAQKEIDALARLASASAKDLGKVGIDAAKIATLARFAARLAELERGWQRARASVSMTPGERALLKEAEALDSKLLAGGRWACRDDAAAQEELTRISVGSGLADTVQDLIDLVAFWQDHAHLLGVTDIRAQDLARASSLAATLGAAARREGSNLESAAALDLRNRCFWAADAHAKEAREGGRYAFRLQPKIAAKFVSRYRVAAVRRSRKKKANAVPVTASIPS